MLASYAQQSWRRRVLPECGLDAINSSALLEAFGLVPSGNWLRLSGERQMVFLLYTFWEISLVILTNLRATSISATPACVDFLRERAHEGIAIILLLTTFRLTGRTSAVVVDRGRWLRTYRVILSGR